MKRALFACAVAVLAVLAFPAPARAHAELVLSAPADGQVFQESPRQLLLQFTEQVGIPADGVRLLRSDGSRVDTGAPAHRTGDNTSVETTLDDALPEGVYTVAWRVVSADSHPVQGAYAFTVGSPSASGVAPVPGSDHTAVEVTYGVVRWVGFGALALLIGACFFSVFCWPAAVTRPAVRAMVWTGWGGSLAVAAASALVYGPYAAGVPLSRALDTTLIGATLDTRLGQALAVRAVLLLLLAPALLLLLRCGPGRRRTVATAAVLGAGGLLALTWSVANHSAVGTVTALAVPVDATHLVAMSVWLGGLAVLAAVLLPSRDLAGMRAAVPAFSGVALVCVTVLVTTGLFQAWRQVRTASALTNTEYGRLLLLKVGLVGVLVLLAAGAQAWVRRHYGEGPAAGRSTGAGRWRLAGEMAGRPPARQSRARRRVAGGPDPHQAYFFRRRIATETGLGVAVLVLSAVLVATEPARVANATPETAVAAGAGKAGPAATAAPLPAGAMPFVAGARRGLILVQVEPARVGQAALHLSIMDSGRRPMAVAEANVALRLRDRDIGPLPVELLEGGTGHYLAAVSLPMAGRWEVEVTVRTSDIDRATVRTTVDVAA